MAANDTTGGGEEAFAYFLTSGLPGLIIAFAEIQGVAIESGQKALAEELNKLIDRLLAAVQEVAVKYAAVADGFIIEKIMATKSMNRPDTGNMEQHIKSEPGPLGLVRVALIRKLDELVNERGYGPFWRAQEFGTGVAGGGYGGGEIPTQIGRRIRGTFDPSGDPPQAAQRGLGVGTDLAFISDRSAPGTGRISVDLPGRHFLQDGAAKAGEQYVAAMAEIQDRYRAEFKRMMAEFTKSIALQRPFRFYGTIQA